MGQCRYERRPHGGVRPFHQTSKGPRFSIVASGLVSRRFSVYACPRALSVRGHRPGLYCTPVGQKGGKLIGRRLLTVQGSTAGSKPRRNRSRILAGRVRGSQRSGRANRSIGSSCFSLVKSSRSCTALYTYSGFSTMGGGSRAVGQGWRGAHLPALPPRRPPSPSLRSCGQHAVHSGCGAGGLSGDITVYDDRSDFTQSRPLQGDTRRYQGTRCIAGLGLQFGASGRGIGFSV